MKFSEPITIEAEVITPIHIGSGEEIKPLSYVTDRGFVYVVDEDKFFNFLSEKEHELFQNFVEKMVSKLEEIDRKISDARSNFGLRRVLNRKRRELEEKLSLNNFIKDYLQKDPVNFVQKNCEAYRVRYFTTRISRGFKSFIKGYRMLPYIPGSEIKGSIRTSVIYELLCNQKYKKFQKKVISLRNILERGKVKEKIEKILSTSDELERELIRGKKWDPKYDLLKFISIRDSEFLDFSTLNILSSYSFGTERFTATLIEVLIPGTKVKFELSFMKDQETDSLWALKELGLSHLEEWLSIDKIFGCIHHRSQDILDEDIRFFAGNKGMTTLLNKLKAENTPTAPLLRIGAGQGFLSTTVNLLVKNRDKNLYEDAIRKGVSFLRRWRTQPSNFPKTRRVIEKKREAEILPLGWMKLTK